MNAIIPFENLVWQSDWNGEECGYDDIDVVGLYNLKYTNIYLYINVENGLVLEYLTEE